MTFYLDTSVVVPYFTVEATTPVVLSYVGTHIDSIAISSLAAGEFASAISRLRRMQRLTDADAVSRMTAFDRWTDGIARIVETEGSDIHHAVAIVRRLELGLRMPDAVHAATCARLGLTLVTFDLLLAGAARTLGIDVVVPA